MTITGGSGLGKDEIDRMVKEPKLTKPRQERKEDSRNPQPADLRLSDREARQRQ